MTKKTVEDLMEAAGRADYKAIKACLDDGVFADSIEDSYYISPMMELIGTSYDGPKRKDTQTMECIKLLFENGANLNHTDSHGNSVMDVLGENLPSANPKDLYNAAKFILTHGGRARNNRDYVIRCFDEYSHIMSKEEFEQFEKIGSLYKAEELKRTTRERGTSGKKMGLRAYLKNKTAPKGVSKNARITKRGGNEGM